MIEGTGEAVATVEVAAAFAFLADPHNSTRWFAGADLALPTEGPLREGLTWRLEKTAGTRHVLPMRMTVYEPPARFVWETQLLPGLATNNVWELRFQAGDEAGTTRLQMFFRLRLSPAGWLTRVIAPQSLRRTLDTQAQAAVDRAAAALANRGRSRKHERRDTPGGKSSARGRKRR